MERLQIGPVEKAVRNRVSVGAVLLTPTARGRFTVAEIGNRGPVLLLGEKEARTLIPWSALEGVPGFLSAKAWSAIGGVYDQAADPTTLDGYMKQFVNRATAGWVACLLEAAKVVEIDRRPPARVRMRLDFPVLERGPEEADDWQGKTSVPRSQRLQEEARLPDLDDNVWLAPFSAPFWG